MPPKKIINKRKTSTQEQPTQSQNIFQNLLKKKNKEKKIKSRSTSRGKSDTSNSRAQIQTKLPYKCEKAKGNKRNKQSQSKQQISLTYPLEGEYHVKQKRLKDAKLKLVQKLMKVQAQKMKWKNQYLKVEKRLMKNYRNSDQNIKSDGSDWEQGLYVIYHRGNEGKEKQQLNTEELTSIILHKNSQCQVIQRKRQVQPKEEVSSNFNKS